jgi:hypothetical protein
MSTNKPKKNILFICGSMNQTTMMHQISTFLSEFNCYFTPYYADGYIDKLARNGVLDFTVLGGERKETTMKFLWDNHLKVDYYGNSYNYDLVLTCSDLIIQKNIKNKKTILVQEGMTDPKSFAFYLVKWFKFPRYLANTSTNGMSNEYDYFCVASEGYADMFEKNGVDRNKIKVTGIPNFDNCVEYYNNDFPHKNFVLAATSDSRETFRWENRKKFIKNVLEIAKGRQIIFKLHPNEYKERAVREISKMVPGALIYTDGNVHEMIANCDVLITKFSTVVYTGLALGKEVYSDFDLDELKKLTPNQNQGTSAKKIAELCLELLREPITKFELVNNNVITSSLDLNYQNHTV